jgi:hypothetical protein
MARFRPQPNVYSSYIGSQWSWKFFNFCQQYPNSFVSIPSQCHIWNRWIVWFESRKVSPALNQSPIMPFLFLFLAHANHGIFSEGSSCDSCHDSHNLSRINK